MNAEQVATATQRAHPARHLVMTIALSLVALGAALPELATERYGASSFLSQVPAGPRLVGASGPLILGGLMLVLLQVDPRKRPPRSLRVWSVISFAWLVSAAFSASGILEFQWLSLAAFLAYALAPHAGLTVAKAGVLATWGLRAFVYASLIVAFTAPQRSYAPYHVWPGGWFEDQDRLQGLFPHPNTLGFVAALLVLIELARLSSGRVVRPMAAAATAAYALYETGSRTPTVALVAAILALVTLSATKRGPIVRFLSWMLLFAVVPLVSYATIVAILPSGVNGRVETWGAAFASFVNNPMVGRGPGLAGTASGDLTYAHNQFLQTAAELGIIGLAALSFHLVFFATSIKGGPPLGFQLLVFWLVTFLTENVLRFAATSFTIQVLAMQLLAYSAMRVASDSQTVNGK